MKKIIITATFIVASSALYADYQQDMYLKALSLSPEQQPEEQLHEAMSSLSKIMSKNIYPRANTDVAKVTALYGTWIVTYSVGSKSYTDKITLDSTYTSSTNGEISASGLYYFNQTGNGQTILCDYSPFASLNSDYMCITGSSNTVYRVFTFNYSGNTITNGYYGVGENADALFASLASKSNILLGYRVTVPPSPTSTPTPKPTAIPTPPTSNIDEYDPVTQKLTLPKVKVGNDYYSVIFTNKGDNIFYLNSATKK